MDRIIEVPTISDERGKLTVVDGHLPFAIKRLFYIYDVTQPRGGHRHIETQMGLIALNGSIEIYCQTPKDDQPFILNNPAQVLLLDPEDWHTMNKFSKGAVLLVLCSHSWNKEDYIYDSYREIKND